MLKAIIWDFDGTLVDSRRKNMNVTKAVIREVTGKTIECFPVLNSMSDYEIASNQATNWKEFYSKEFELTDDQVNSAGSLWTKYQLIDQTPVHFFEGIEKTIKSLGHYIHGIVSQNSRENIYGKLSSAGLSQYFKTIIGYEEVDYSMQKPHPEGLIYCLSQLTPLKKGEIVLFIGDHETDAACAVNANNRLTYKAVFSVGAFYEKNDYSGTWTYQPDFKANHPGDILEIVNNLDNN